MNPAIRVFQKARPLLVPIIEAGEQDWEGAEMASVRRYLGELMAEAGSIDALLWPVPTTPSSTTRSGATSPGTSRSWSRALSWRKNSRIICVGTPGMERRLSHGAARTFLTTDLTDRFDRLARTFFGEPIQSHLISLEVTGRPAR